MLTDLKICVVSFITAILINYSLSQDYGLLTQSLQSLDYSQPRSLLGLQLSLLLKPAELLILLILPGHRRLIRFELTEG